MVTQYPHTISFTVITGSVKDSQGDWSTGTPSMSPEYNCRFEIGSGNAFFQSTDGEKIYFNGIVYMGSNIPDIPLGAMVIIKEGDKVLSNSKVLRHSVGQLNKRAWL